MKKLSRLAWRCLAVCIVLLSPGVTAAQQAAYDPLATGDPPLPEPFDLTVHDARRDRDIPIRMYLPADTTPAPVVLFSHGLGGSREGSAYLGRHWSARGYAAVFLQHPGYELVLDRAEHSAFTDRALPGDMEPRNPNHHRAILALSTAFWDATLREDPAARAWRDGSGPASVLEEDDRWQRK